MKKNLYLVGPLAAGKSTIGKALAEAMDFAWIDTDKEIVRRTGVELNWIVDQEGEDGFAKRESILIAELVQRDNLVLSTGGGTVLAAENRELLHQTGIVIYLKVSVQKQVERTEKDRLRPWLRCDDKKQKLNELAIQLNNLYASIADITVSTDKASVPSLVAKLQKKITEWLASHNAAE